MKAFCLGDKETVIGFNLAGVEGKEIYDPFSAKEAFSVALADEEIAVVIITEKTAALVRKEVDAQIYSRKFPLVIEIPDKDGPAKDRKEIKELIKEAVGISI